MGKEMIRSGSLGFLLLFPLLGRATGALGQAEVSLWVRNRTGVDQINVPVRGGVPFPRGVLKEGVEVRVVAADGQELPGQVRPLAHWYDGSVNTSCAGWTLRRWSQRHASGT
jgi:hypothetical protein